MKTDRTLELYIGIKPDCMGLHNDYYPAFSSFIGGKVAKAGTLVAGNPDDY